MSRLFQLDVRDVEAVLRANGVRGLVTVRHPDVPESIYAVVGVNERGVVVCFGLTDGVPQPPPEGSTHGYKSDAILIDSREALANFLWRTHRYLDHVHEHPRSSEWATAVCAEAERQFTFGWNA